MSFRQIAVKGNCSSVSSLTKCSLNCLIWSYLLCHLMLQTVIAVSDEPMTKSLEPKDDTQRAVERIHLAETPTIMKVKRAAPRGQYNFGIGKKFDPELGEDQSNDSDDTLDLIEDKRAQQRFQFGLGKRAQRFAFGLGKRNPYDNRFQFGLGKRAVPKDNRFSFGLGKRQPNYDEYIKRRYSFGLGKRTPIESLVDSQSSSEELSDR